MNRSLSDLEFVTLEALHSLKSERCDIDRIELMIKNKRGGRGVIRGNQLRTLEHLAKKGLVHANYYRVSPEG